MKKSPVNVDRTKPSTACEPCRKRRAKCDRQRPHCSQCIRSGNTCSGYRDNLDLVIRDQNEKVFRAVQKKASFVTKRTSPGKSTSAQIKLPIRSERQATPNANARAIGQTNRGYVPLMLKDTMRGMAVSYFVTHFGHGVYLDWLPTLFKASRQSPMLESSLDAVGTLYLSQHDRRSELTEDARAKFSVALQEITSALSVPSRRVQDDTIASVMLIALFSAWSNPAPEAARTWTYHINGAMNLLDMRSPESFNGYVIQWLLGHVIGAVQLDCVNRFATLPPQLLKLCKLSVQGKWDYQVHFWQLIEGLARLRELISRSPVDPEYIIEQAISLDAQAARLARVMPLPPELEANPGPHRIQLKDCPVHYPAHRIVQALNTLRLVRLEMNHHIAQQNIHSHIKNGTKQLREQAIKTIQHLVEEICESVPEFLRVYDRKSIDREDTNMWICNLLWAFTFAAECQLVSEPLKRRVLFQLEVFAQATDMPHVSKAASQVALGQGIPEGLHVFYLC